MPSPIRSEIEALILDIKSDDQQNLSAQLSFPDNFIGFKGHFPGKPILPGVCQIQCALVLLSRILNGKVELVSIKKVKFLNTVEPNEMITLSGSAQVQGANIEAKLKVTKDIDGGKVNVSRLHIQGLWDRES